MNSIIYNWIKWINWNIWRLVYSFVSRAPHLTSAHSSQPQRQLFQRRPTSPAPPPAPPLPSHLLWTTSTTTTTCKLRPLVCPWRPALPARRLRNFGVGGTAPLVAAPGTWFAYANEVIILCLKSAATTAASRPTPSRPPASRCRQRHRRVLRAPWRSFREVIHCRRRRHWWRHRPAIWASVATATTAASSTETAPPCGWRWRRHRPPPKSTTRTKKRSLSKF